MNISYKRMMNRNYMILEGEETDVGFEGSMLQENTIPSLLEFSSMEMNGCLQFQYEITGKKSLRDFFEQEGITEENLRIAFFGIRDALLSLSEYLIGEEHVFLHPDTIFLEQKKTGYVSLCYSPFYHSSYMEQLQTIMEYVISIVDHHKSNVTKLCYEMYAVTEQSQFTILDLLAILEENEEELYMPKPTGERHGEEVNGLNHSEKTLVHEISEDEIRKAAYDVGEDYFEEESSAHCSFSKRMKESFKKWREKIFAKKSELFPEDDYLEDIEFDEIVPKKEPETKTVLLSEDASVCCGKLIHDMGGVAEDIFVSHTPFRIGSKPGGNDAVLSSPAVSRYHAKITRKDGIFFLEDLNSTNGTTVNGRELNYHEVVPLKAMDSIAFADVVYHII